jgi:hypothetical protein
MAIIPFSRLVSAKNEQFSTQRPKLKHVRKIANVNKKNSIPDLNTAQVKMM